MNRNVLDNLSNQITKANKPARSTHVNKKAISCHRLYCLSKVVCRCTECSFYYCYEHVQTHPHPREKLEILEDTISN